ncbi:hypothetical protein Pmani_013287 [Petrolisthes manimaculis]|uniref:Uncharacterized protein n=1 Tax=Petrolisthes manimaculis TaxID=1843537 RepID=A0AAE1UDT2_9EUCA|nr:hypothetical protein Pmani_013287 [Petrolisthes manimaculis]
MARFQTHHSNIPDFNPSLPCPVLPFPSPTPLDYMPHPLTHSSRSNQVSCPTAASLNSTSPPDSLPYHPFTSHLYHVVSSFLHSYPSQSIPSFRSTALSIHSDVSSL